MFKGGSILGLLEEEKGYCDSVVFVSIFTYLSDRKQEVSGSVIRPFIYSLSSFC